LQDTRRICRFSKDTPTEFTLATKSASPLPQQKGQPLFFGAVRRGKVYVSFHLMPLYMCPKLTSGIFPALKKRMQGKTCFNFKTEPEPELLSELARLTEAALSQWRTGNSYNRQHSGLPAVGCR